MEARRPEAPSPGERLLRVRDVPGLRFWRTSLRTAHLLAFGTLYGGHVYGVAGERLGVALLATAATGGALALLEVWRAPIWLVQVRGAATGLKIVLLAVAQLRAELAVPLLTLAIVLGAVSSHMPGRYRYHSLAHGRVVGPRDRG